VLGRSAQTGEIGFHRLVDVKFGDEMNNQLYDELVSRKNVHIRGQIADKRPAIV